jgi:hypothetical protein
MVRTNKHYTRLQNRVEHISCKPRNISLSEEAEFKAEAKAELKARAKFRTSLSIRFSKYIQNFNSKLFIFQN